MILRWLAAPAVALAIALAIAPTRAAAQDVPQDEPPRGDADVPATDVSEPDTPGAEDGARAREAGAPEVEEERPTEGPPDIPRRELPDYDGRPEPGPDAGDVLVWIPRVIFWPVHAVLEYVIRRPIGWILTTGEREHWDAFQLQPLTEREPSWGVVPTLFFDFGFQPAGGLYLWFDDVIVPGNGLRFQIGFGGTDWLRAMMIDRLTLSPSSSVEIRLEAIERPDYLFVGIGGRGNDSVLSRYRRATLEAALRANFRPWRASHLRIDAGVSANELSDTDFRWDAHEETISRAIDRQWYPGLSTLPPGFDGYTFYYQRVEGSVDTREARPGDGSGVRIEAHAELGVDLHRALDRRWLLWGGGAGAYWDVSAGRTLGLWAVAEFATQLGPEPIPFPELPDIGSRGRMTAFRRGWLIGESVAAAVLEYRYPIWIAVDGFVNVAVGNAFGPYLSDFAAERLRMSYAIGLRTVGDPDQSFTLQIGLGTAAFGDGMDPEIFRITAGMQEGF